jgi:hypothetical protein
LFVIFQGLVISQLFEQLLAFEVDIDDNKGL